MFRVTTIRETADSAREGVGRAFAYSSSRTTLLERLAFGLLTVAGTILVLAIVIPVIVLMVVFIGVAGVLGYCWLRVRTWLVRARQPNGPLDGRRNVRVREPNGQQ